MSNQEVGSSYVSIIPEVNKLHSTLRKELGDGSMGKLGKSAGGYLGNGIGSGISTAKIAIGSAIGNVITKAISGISGSIDSAISRIDTLNNFPKIMANMGISADDSKVAIDRLSAGIDGLPTALNDAVTATARFVSKSGDINKSTDYFLAVNDAILSGGMSMDIQQTALEQLSQSYSKGKMDMQEWRAIQVAMPAQLNQIAKSMGMTADQLGEGLRNGSISMDEFMDKIVELDKEGGEGFASFADQAKTATGGIGTALENVKNRTSKAVAGIIDAIGADSISGAINAFSSKFGALGQIIGGTVTAEDGSKIATGFIGGLKSGFEAGMASWGDNKLFEYFDLDGLISSAQQAMYTFGEVVGKPIAAFVDNVSTNLGRIKAKWDETFGSLNLPEIDWGAVADGISRIVTAIGDFSADVIINGLQTAYDIGMKVAETLGPAIERMQPAFEKIGGAVETFVKPIADFLSGQGPAFESMMERINERIEAMQPIFDELAPALEEFGEHLNNIASVVGPAIAEILGAIGSLLVDLGAIISGVILGAIQLFNDIASVIEGFAAGVGNAVQNIKAGWEGFVNFLSQIPARIGAFFTQIRNDIAAKFEAIISKARTLPGLIIGFFQSLPGRIGAFFSTIASNAVSRLSGMASSIAAIPGRIVSFFASIPSQIAGFFSSAASSAMGALNGLVSSVTSIPSRIVGFFSGLGSRITAAIGSIHFPQPDIWWESVSVGPAKIPVPHIEWHATGGFFDQASIIGVGEAGREMVLPEHGGIMTDFAQAVTAEVDSVQAAEMVISWLGANLPYIIATATPNMTEKQFQRQARKAVAAWSV